MNFEKKNYAKNLKTVTWLIIAMMNFTREKLYLRFFLSQNSKFFIHRPPSSGLNVLANIFEKTKTIYSNSERTEQFLVTQCFFNLFLEVSDI